MRTELREPTTRAGRAVGDCGVWWTGEERLAIAREARAAPACPLCGDRKAAPSPQAVPGTHAAATTLSAAAVEAVHRALSLGREAMTDAAGVIAGFDAITRGADGTGIPLEPTKAEASADWRARLGIDDYWTAKV